MNDVGADNYFGRCFILLIGLMYFMTSSISQAQHRLPAPPCFIENKGQWKSNVRFLARMNGMNAWITGDGVVYDFFERTNPDTFQMAGETPGVEDPFEAVKNVRQTGHIVSVTYHGASNPVGGRVLTIGRNRLNAYHNYFLNRDSTQWAGNVPLYREVHAEQVAPGIAMRYYFDETDFSNNGKRTMAGLRFDVLVEPGANPADLTMHFDGQDRLAVTSGGALCLSTCLGDVHIGELYAYQQFPSGRRIQRPCRFVLQGGGRVGFEVEQFDPSLALVIDPLVWSTFVGGSQEDRVYSLTTNLSGEVLSVGHSYSSNYPVSPGAYKTVFSPAMCAVITKLSSDGSQLIFSTYLGGSTWDWGGGIALDASENIHVTGYCSGAGFPVTAGCYQPVYQGSGDAFVAKLNPGGSSLLYSTFLGGTGQDRGRQIKASGNGDAVILGYTNTAGYIGTFPTTAGAFQTTAGGDADLFVAKFDAGGGLIFSTLLGGSARDGTYNGNVMTIDGSGNVYIADATSSANFPVTPGAYKSTLSGTRDAFVCALNSMGTALLFSTFLGGSGDDFCSSIDVQTGSILVSGGTTSSNFPTTAGAFQTMNAGGQDGFVARLSMTGTSLLASTYLGGNGADEPWKAAPDAQGDIYVAGQTTSTNFPVSATPLQAVNAGAGDVFIAKLNSLCQSLPYSSYLGGSGQEDCYDMNVIGLDLVVIGGYTASANYPTTAGAFDTGYNGGGDCFVTLVDLTGHSITLGTLVPGVCPGVIMNIPYSVNAPFNAGNIFVAQLSDATGSFTSPVVIGTTSSSVSGSIAAVIPANTPAGANYHVRIVASNPASTSGVSTAFTVYAKPQAHAGPDRTVCKGDGILIGQVSTGGTAPFSYSWTPVAGLSNPSIASPIAAPATTTEYVVTVTDANGCIGIDSVFVTIHPMPVANAGDDTTICLGSGAAIGQPATGGTPPFTYFWSPAAGLSSTTLPTVTAGPTVTTQYIVQVTDANGCAARDTVIVTVRNLPTPVITHTTPLTICDGDSVVLTVTPDYDEYHWSSGETTKSIAGKRAGRYNVSVIDHYGCSDSTFVDVTVLPAPLASISGPSDVCPNSEAVYDAPQGTTMSWLWTATGGAIVSGAGSDRVAILWGTTGMGTLRLELKNTSTGCSDTISVQVTIRSALSPHITPSSPVVLCIGDTASLDAGPGYATYRWNTMAITQAIEVTTGGIYIVHVEDAGGCTGDDTVTVVERPRPVPEIEALGSPVFCRGDSVVLRTVQNGVSYQWSTGDTTRSIIVKLPGDYDVTVRDANGCTGRSQLFQVNVHEPPAPVILGPVERCIHGLGVYRDTIGSELNHSWTVRGGVITQGQGSDVITIRWDTLGDGYVEVEAVDPRTGCVGIAKVLMVTVTDGYRPHLTALDSTLCEGDSTVLSIKEVFQNHRWYRDGLRVPGEIGNMLVVGQPGIYTLEASDSSCSGMSNPVTITLLARPSPMIRSTGRLCRGASVTLETTTPFDAYLWSTGATSSTITTFVPGAYSVRVWNRDSCDAVANFIVVMDSVPLISSEAWRKSACLNSMTTFQVYDSAGYAYEWRVTGGTIENGAGTSCVTVRWSETGTGTVFIRVRSTSGCEDSALVHITVSSQLTPSLHVNGVLIPRDTIVHRCIGQMLTLSTDTGFVTYSWSPAGTTDMITALVSVGSISYKVSVVDSFGCSGNTVTVIVVGDSLPQPVIMVDGPKSICHGDSVRLRVAGSFVRYRWSDGSVTPEIWVNKTGNYTVEVEDVNGCMNTSAVVRITTSPRIMPVISGDSAVCAQAERAYQVAYLVNGTYNWTVQGGVITDSTETSRIRVHWGSTGPGRIMVTITENGCEAADTLDVAIGDSLHVLVQASKRVLCPNDSATLCASSGGVAYAWSTGETTPCITIRNPGVYHVAVRDISGCAGTSAPLTITSVVPTAPIVVADGRTSFCRGDSVHLTTLIPQLSYRWSSGETSRTITVRESGRYRVMVLDSAGCEVESAPMDIDVHPAQAPVVMGPDRLCLGDTTQYSTVRNANLTYNWTILPLDGDGRILDGGGTDRITIAWTRLGQVSIRLTVIDTVLGCTASVDTSIVVESMIVPMVTLDPPGQTFMCAGSSLVLRTSSGYARYEWLRDGNSVGTFDSLVATVAGTYQVRIWTQSGCIGTSEPIMITLQPSPRPKITTPDEIEFCAGNTACLFAGKGFTSYQWRHNGIAMPDATLDFVTVELAGRYSVLVTDTNGCDGVSADFLVTVYPPPVPVITVVGATLTSSPAVAYTWYLDGARIPGSNTQVLQATSSGMYRVCVEDIHGCEGCSVAIRIDPTMITSTVSMECGTSRLVASGTRVQYPITMVKSENLADTTITFTAEISFDRLVLAPLFAFDTVSTAGRDLTGRVRGTRPPSLILGKIADLEFLVLLADTSCARVSLKRFHWSDDRAEIAIMDTACMVCVNVCHEGGERLVSLEGRVALHQNQPNPFNAETRIEYEIIETGTTDLSVYDSFGRRIATLVHGAIPAGRYAVHFTAGSLPSGLYFSVLTTPHQSLTRAMLVIR